MDLSAIVILLTGLGLGFVHSLDADHIVAVTALVCNNKSLRKSVTSATVWGIGHSAILLIVGLAVLVLRITIPESVVNIFEFAAAVLLIVLGAYVLKPLIHELNHRRQHKAGKAHPHPHTHTHTHSQHEHSHTHLHMHILPHSYSHEAGHEEGNGRHLKSAFTGALQGLGGTAALMLVTLATVNTLEMGVGFIVIFGAGVIVGMVSVVCILGSILTYTATRLEKVHRIILAVTGSVSIAFGICIILGILI
jgi:ABC-type nickel/cobalt efflux system permease component RcnA